jgi:RNA polymerase sigma factor (sigma-70 family)
MTDLELLAEYSRNRSDEAFTALVERYIRLVHSSCWRQLGEAQLAEDATQMVFVLLSKKAATLRHAELAGWLLTTAHFTCANMKRSEGRRARRELVVAMNADETCVAENHDLLQLLDEGLLRLRPDDREALVARFLREEPLRHVGESLGLSEDAARKRVERGLDKLRQFFRDRGVATDSAALAAVLADHSHVPPIADGLTPRIVHAAKSIPSAALRPELILLASIVMAAALGITGWRVFKWESQEPIAEPIAAAAPVNPAPAATQPVSDEPLPNRSTPDHTLVSLCHAMFAADLPAIEACLLTDPNPTTTPLDAALGSGLAHRHLILAGEKAFGPDADKLFGNEVPVEAVLQGMIVLRQLQGDVADITGNSATISVQIPPPLLQSMPADMQQMLLTWSGKRLYFELRDGAWLFDLNRSMHFVMKVVKQRNGTLVRADNAMIISFMQDDMNACDWVRGQIEQGQLQSLSDVRAALHEKQNALMAKYGVFGWQTFDAPGKAEEGI